MFGFLSRKKTVIEQYQELADKRRAKLKYVRKQALRQVTSEYPDVRILITENAQKFIGYSAQNRKIISGHFIDLPILNNPGYGSSDDDYVRAISEFEEKRKLIDEFIALGGVCSGKRYQDLWTRRPEDLERGFVYYAFDSRRAVEANLICDEECLWGRFCDTGQDLKDLKRVMESTWKNPSHISNKTSFRLRVQIVLAGFGSSFPVEFDCRFLGGTSLVGQSKENFYISVIEPIYEFIASVPIWAGDFDQFIEYLESIDINDNERM